jgi:hypothetical protein
MMDQIPYLVDYLHETLHWTKSSQLIGCSLMPSVGVLSIPCVFDFFLVGIGGV